MSKRQDQIRFVVEQTLNEGERLDAFKSGVMGVSSTDYEVDAYKLQKARDSLNARDPAHPALGDLDTKIRELRRRSRSASNRKGARRLGIATRGVGKFARGASDLFGLTSFLSNIPSKFGELALGAGTQSVTKPLGIGQASTGEGEVKSRIT